METADVPQAILNELHRDPDKSLTSASLVNHPKTSTTFLDHDDNDTQQGFSILQRDSMYPDSSTARHHFQSHFSNNEAERNDGCLPRSNSILQESTCRLDGTTCVTHIAISPNSPGKDDLSTTPSLNSTNDDSAKQECIDPSKKRLSTQQETTRLGDIIGHDDVKLRIAELTLPLALPESILNSVFTGIRRLPTTILLIGPPGCGKTKLARAIAGEAAAALIQVSPSDILSKFVGESEALIKNIFCNAVEQGLELDSRCAVIFIDEIDALGQNRDNSGVGEGEACSRRILTELLLKLNVVLDRKLCTLQDFGETSTPSSDEPASTDRKVRIVVAAATNRPDDCDCALLRRFELTLQVGLPSPQDRLLMFEKHLNDIDHNLTTRELHLLSAMTGGWSGSGIETLCRDAVQTPVRDCIRHAIVVGKRAADSPSEALREDHSNKAYDALLAGITALRPVTLCDFQNSIHHVTGQAMPDLLEEDLDVLSSSLKKPRLDT